MSLDAHWAWLLAALVLATAELAVPGAFLIWIAAAAALTGVAALVLGVPFGAQLLLFALFSVASVLAGRRYAGAGGPSADPLLNDRAARLTGETLIVVDAIRDGRGRVRVGDGVWAARGPDADAGARVRVTGADGTCLRVEPLLIDGPSTPSDTNQITS
jgi:membrane protein implicated in regulation of membrane protease activity